jgi:formate dehydrogenase major subunit
VESVRVNPGVIYTTFHHAETKANVVTSDLSDWATNCPEYKVTAVEVTKVTSPERQRAESSVTQPAQQERETEEIAVGEEV